MIIKIKLIFSEFKESYLKKNHCHICAIIFFLIIGNVETKSNHKNVEQKKSKKSKKKKHHDIDLEDNIGGLYLI